MNDAKLSLIACIIFVALMPFCFAGCYGCSKVQVSEGYRDSSVRKVSETGVIWKTWEVETLGYGVRFRNNQNCTTPSIENFQYSACDPAIITKLRAIPPGKIVRIHYRKQLTAWSPSGESQYFITAIDELPEPTPTSQLPSPNAGARVGLTGCRLSGPSSQL